MNATVEIQNIIGEEPIATSLDTVTASYSRKFEEEKVKTEFLALLNNTA